MTGTPTWQAPATGQPPKAAQGSQFLATHAITYVWTGTLQSSQQTGGTGSAASNGLWIAQSFTTGAAQTTVGYVMWYGSATGSPAAPWAVSLQADNGSGAPSGTPLSSASMPREFAAAPSSWRPVMLPASGLTPSARYWIVAAAAGDASDYFFWDKSNQASGASTSSNGTTWTAQAYGLLYQVFDQSVVPPLAGTWEDSGARWTSLAYTSGQVTGIGEYTTGQTAAGYAVSSRVLSYSGADLTGVA